MKKQLLLISNKVYFIFLMFIVFIIDLAVGFYCIVLLFGLTSIQTNDDFVVRKYTGVITDSFTIEDARQVLLSDLVNELFISLIVLFILVIFTYSIYILQKKIEKKYDSYIFKYGDEVVSNKINNRDNERILKNQALSGKYLQAADVYRKY